MTNDIERNLNKNLQFLDLADEHKADLIFFPELAMTLFFPQYPKREVGGALNHIPDEFALDIEDSRIYAMVERCRDYRLYASCNLYIRDNGGYYNASLWLGPDGSVEADSRMTHVVNATNFHERDYYLPSDNGFFVYETPFGKVGIVSGYDRHIPETIAACAAKGADLVIIPAANVETELMDMYEWELRVEAFQNGVFIAMANRVGIEGALVFCGQSMVVDPNGNIVVKADDSQQFIICNIELTEARLARSKRSYRDVFRPELFYAGQAADSRSSSLQ